MTLPIATTRDLHAVVIKLPMAGSSLNRYIFYSCLRNNRESQRQEMAYFFSGTTMMVSPVLPVLPGSPLAPS